MRSAESPDQPTNHVGADDPTPPPRGPHAARLDAIEGRRVTATGFIDLSESRREAARQVVAKALRALEGEVRAGRSSPTRAGTQ
jgi:hypothetical protein